MAQVSIRLIYGDLAYLQKKPKGQINDILFSVGFFYSLTFTTFFLYCTWQLGRGAGSEKKKEHRHAAVAYLEIASSHAGLISTFRFSMLVYFSLHIWITPPFSAMDVAIQRQLNQCTLEELIQIAIHLIFEIQYRLALLEQSEYGTSDCGISDSDDEL